MVKLLRSKIFTIIALAALFGLVNTLVHNRSKTVIVKKEVADMEAKISSVQKANDRLEKFLEYFKNPTYLEREARIRLNYKLEGEEMAYVYPDTSTLSSKSEDFRALLPNYKKWFYYLLGR